MVLDCSCCCITACSCAQVWLYRGYKCGMEVRSLGWHAIGLLVPGRLALEVSASQSKAVPSLFECLISSSILCIPVILQHSNTRRSVSTLLDAMIWLTVSGYWWCTSLLQQRSFIHLLLPRVVYCLAFIRLFVNERSPDRVELVPLKIVNTLLPVVLIVRPSKIVCLLSFSLHHSCYLVCS